MFFAWSGFRVTPVTQLVWPEPMSEPFLYSSARTSNCVP